MLLKEDFNKDLLPSIGFEQNDPEEWDSEDYTMRNAQYVLRLGHSRRGQVYHLIISKNLLSVYATEPDGSGGSTPFTKEAVDAIIKLQAWDAFQ